LTQRRCGRRSQVVAVLSVLLLLLKTNSNLQKDTGCTYKLRRVSSASTWRQSSCDTREQSRRLTRTSTDLRVRCVGFYPHRTLVSFILVRLVLDSEFSMCWVDPWVGLGWIGSTIAKVLQKFERIMLMHLKHG